MNTSNTAAMAAKGVKVATSCEGSVEIMLVGPDNCAIKVIQKGVEIDVIWPLSVAHARIVAGGDDLEWATVALTRGEAESLLVEVGKIQAFSIIGYMGAAVSMAPKGGEASRDPAHAAPSPRRWPGKLAIAAVVLLSGIFAFEVAWSLSGAAHEEAARSWIRANHPDAEAAIFGQRVAATPRGPSLPMVPSAPAPAVDAASLPPPAPSSPAPSAPAPGSAWSRPLPGRG